MFTHRHTPIALVLLSLYSAQTLAADNTEKTQTDERINVLVVKGYSAPNATNQDYSGNTVIDIVPTDTDVNKSLDELIAENTPGFIHTNSGTSKHNSNNYHRGLSDTYTLYLLNGVPFPTTTLGSQNIPNIPMESIALIEVIRGAKASLYGSSSLTGVINIITKTGDTADAQINFSAGSNDTQRVGGVYANNYNNFQFMTSLDIDKSDGYDFIDGYDDDFGYESYSMNSYLAYVNEKQRFSLAINNARSDIDYYDYSGTADEEADTLQLTAKYIQQFNTHFTSELTLSKASVESESFSSYSTVDRYTTDETLAQLHLNSEWEKITVNFGGEYTYSEFESNDNTKDRDQTALYIAASGNVTDYLNVSAGLRNDNFSDFGNAFTYSTGISLFDAVELSYKTSFSAPSYNDLYYSTSYGQGDPNLEAEEGEILELSLTHDLDTKHAYIPLKLNLYTGSLDNKITWETDENYFSTPVNIGEVSIKGVEAYIQYNASKYVFDIAASYTESIDKSTNEQLDNVPEWSGSSSIQYNVTTRIQPKLTYSYIGKRTTSYYGDLDESHLLDFAINYQVLDNISLGLNVNNITDNTEQVYGGYEADGRTFLVTIGANM